MSKLSSRLDTGLVHDPKLTWAGGESETKGKGEKVCGSNLMLYRCVLIADWLTPELMGEWWVRAGSGRGRFEK